MRRTVLIHVGQADERMCRIFKINGIGVYSLVSQAGGCRMFSLLSVGSASLTKMGHYILYHREKLSSLFDSTAEALALEAANANLIVATVGHRWPVQRVLRVAKSCNCSRN